MAEIYYPVNKWLRNFVDKNDWNYDDRTGILESKGRTYNAGLFEHINLEELDEQLNMMNNKDKSDYNGLTFQIVQGNDIGELILNSENGEVFQVASQLNALEMIDSSKTPRDGIEIYALDNTQGPRAALACVAGTFVRNYNYSDFNALYDVG